MAATHQTPAVMQQPAVKQQPLASMQQPATKQQPSAAMQPLSLAESPIFQWNYSAESSNLEDTANNDNCHIDFNKDLSIHSIIYLATSGLRRSPRISEKESDKNHYVLSCNTIMKCFCVFGVAMASLWTPGESSLYCRTQKLVFASVNTFHLANQNFDSALNALHLMVLLAEKENNESYTFG